MKAIATDHDRIPWLQARMKGIGASDSPKILGLTKWGSPLSVYSDKVADPGLIDDDPMTSGQRVGHLLEEGVGEELASYYGGFWKRDGTLYRSDERPHMLATRDGVIEKPNGEKRSGEVKTWAFDDWEGELPPHVYCQVQHQAYVFEEEDVPVGVCFRVSGEIACTAVPRDQAFIDGTLLPACDDFWKRVQAGDPSGFKVDSSDLTLKALAKAFPAEEGKEIVLDADFEDLADELLAIREEAKGLDERKKEIRNQFAAAAGDATLIILPSGRYFNYKTTEVPAREQKAYSFRTPMGPFGKG